MSEFQCENCHKSSTQTEKICLSCGYPIQGSKSEKISYNTKLLRYKDLVADSDKSVTAILSFSIIFLFMALVVLAFSLIFGESHYEIAFLFGAASIIYFMLNRLGKKSAYLMVILALLFYISHTIFEFSNGIFPKSPIDVGDSFTESKGASIVYAMIPMAYILIRVTLIIVLMKYLFTQIKLKKEDKMVHFIREEAKS